MNKILASVKSGVSKVNMKLLTSTSLATTMVVATSVSAFAVEPPASTPLPTIAITSEMLAPLVQGVVSNVGVILPVGVGLFAIFLGIRIIPGMISRFVKM